MLGLLFRLPTIALSTHFAANASITQPVRRWIVYLRLAVVSPFVDRWHGTERALAELLERLAGDFGCEIHLYAQRVEDLHVSDPKWVRSAGSTEWAPSSGTRFLVFRGRMCAIPRLDVLDGFLRWWHTTLGGASYDVVFSPGINCLHPDVVIVHALFHRLKSSCGKRMSIPGASQIFFGGFTAGLLPAADRARASDLHRSGCHTCSRLRAHGGPAERIFSSKMSRVIPNGVDTSHFSVAARLARRTGARQRRLFAMRISFCF